MPLIVKFHLFLIQFPLIQSRVPSNPNKKILYNEHEVYFHFIILCLFLHYFLSICRVIIHQWDFSYCLSKQRSNFKGPRRLEHDSVAAVKSQVKLLGTQSLFPSLQTRQLLCSIVASSRCTGKLMRCVGQGWERSSSPSLPTQLPREAMGGELAIGGDVCTRKQRPFH